MRRSAAAVIVGGLLCFVPATASAQAKPTAAECIDSFENGQRAQKNGHLVFAHRLYAECVVNACPKQVRNDCVQGQSDTDRAIGTVSIVVRDAAGADVAATIKVDGNPFTPEPGRAVPIDPGPHELQYTVNSETKSTSITIAEGEKSRVIVLPAPTAAPTTEASPPPSQITATAPSTKPTTAPIVGPAVVAGGGVLLLLGFAGMYAVASSEASQRDEQQKIANDPTKTAAERAAATSSTNSHNSSANDDQTIAIVLGVGGLVLVAGGVTWYLLGRRTRRAEIVPVVTPHYAGTAFSFAF